VIYKETEFGLDTGFIWHVAYNSYDYNLQSNSIAKSHWSLYSAIVIHRYSMKSTITSTQSYWSAICYPLVPASIGGCSPYWIPELSLSHSYSNTWLTVLICTVGIRAREDQQETLRRLRYHGSASQYHKLGSRNSSTGIATGYRQDGSGIGVRVSVRYNPIGLLPQGKRERSVKLTTHL
jgi:hypothetical protein